MLNANHSLVVHFDDQIARRNGKMGHGVLRFTANPVVGCIDRHRHGENSRDVLGFGPDCPVVEDVAQALSLGGAHRFQGQVVHLPHQVQPPGGTHFPPDGDLARVERFWPSAPAVMPVPVSGRIR